MIISSTLLHSSNSNVLEIPLSLKQFQAGNPGGCRSGRGTEVALALVLCDRLPVFTHVAPTGVAGGSNASVLQLLSVWFMLSHHLRSLCGSALCCTAVVAQQSSPLPPPPLPQIPTPALASGLCKPKEKVLPMAEGLQLSRRDLAAALPSPLACFALSGGHHTLFCVIAH